MRTTLWAWADAQGLTVRELASRLHYHERHLYLLRSGRYPITPAFAGRVVLIMGEWARALFEGASESGAEREMAGVRGEGAVPGSVLEPASVASGATPDAGTL